MSEQSISPDSILRTLSEISDLTGKHQNNLRGAILSGKLKGVKQTVKIKQWSSKGEREVWVTSLAWVREAYG